MRPLLAIKGLDTIFNPIPTIYDPPEKCSKFKSGSPGLVFLCAATLQCFYQHYDNGSILNLMLLETYDVYRQKNKPNKAFLAEGIFKFIFCAKTN